MQIKGIPLLPDEVELTVGTCLTARYRWQDRQPLKKPDQRRNSTMFRVLLLATAIMVPTGLAAGERVSATNFYVVKQEQFNAGTEVFWAEDNIGSFTVSEGPIDPRFARCVGSGFGGPGGVQGDGICVYGEGDDTFTMKWKIESFGHNTWQIVHGTGKYAGMSGQGTTKTRVESKFLKLSHRVSDWEGEIELPGRE